MSVANASDHTRFEFTQPHMGTAVRIALYAPDETAARTAAKAAFERVAQLDQIMSDYRESSELMQLCRQAGGPPVRVSADLFSVLAKSQEISRQSDGAFDITAAPIIRLWRRARRQRELPAADRLAQARELVGFEKLILDEKNRTAQLLKKGMLLDLGGIAKGYAADEAQIVLRKHGVRQALVAAGGDIVVSDPPPGAKGWKIDIAPLKVATQHDPTHLLLQNIAVSTSGDAEQFVEIAGQRYSHIIDPRTGMALTGQSSVTVIARRGIDADSLGTAVSVLGPDQGIRLVDCIPDVACLFIQAAETGVAVRESKYWQKLTSK